MAGESKITTDHEEIRRWLESRGGVPVEVMDNPTGTNEGYLQVEFPGYDRGESARKIDWQTFFQRFEERNLAFQYQDENPRGGETHNFRLIDRDDVAGNNRRNDRGGIREDV